MVTSTQTGKDQKNQKLFRILILISTAALILFSSNSNMLLQPALSVNHAILLIPPVCTMCVALMFQKKICVTKVWQALLLMALFYLFQFFLLGAYSERLFSYFSVLYPLLVFACLGQIEDKQRQILARRFVILSLLLIALLSIMTVIYVDYIVVWPTQANNPEVINEAKYGRTWADLINKTNNFKDYARKLYYQIPLGGSNYIASILLLFLAALSFVSGLRRSLRFSLFILGAVALLLYKSMGASMVFLLLLPLLLFFHREEINRLIMNQWRCNPLKTLQAHKKAIKRIGLIIVGLVSVVITVLFLYLMFMKRDTGVRAWDIIFSGRFRIYEETLTYIAARPLFGYGFQFDSVMKKPHNFLLTILAYGGILGLVLFLLPFFFIIRQSLKRDSRGDRATLSILFVAFLHGMIEPNLFNACFDFFFWTLLAAFYGLNSHETEEGKLLTRANFFVSLRAKPAAALGFALLSASLISLLIFFSPARFHQDYAQIHLLHMNQIREDGMTEDMPEYKLGEERPKSLRMICDYANLAPDCTEQINRNLGLDIHPQYHYTHFNIEYQENNDYLLLEVFSSQSNPREREMYVRALAEQVLLFSKDTFLAVKEMSITSLPVTNSYPLKEILIFLVFACLLIPGTFLLFDLHTKRRIKS